LRILLGSLRMIGLLRLFWEHVRTMRSRAMSISSRRAHEVCNDCYSLQLGKFVSLRMASVPSGTPLTFVISSAIVCRPPLGFKLYQFIVEPNITVFSGQISLSLVDLVLDGFILFLLLLRNGYCVLLEPIDSISNHRLRHGLFRDDGLLPRGITGCLFKAQSPVSLRVSALGSLNIWGTMQAHGWEWGMVIGLRVDRHICRVSCRDAVALRHGTPRM
jgi:hypothetical protein